MSEAEIVVQHIALERIVPTMDNPRMFRKNDPKLAELAESIKSVGVLSPILCRPLDDDIVQGGIELRAGERRLRAAKMAGLKTIPAIVREMSDREALEITITENLQRDDLHPLEEATGIQALLDGGWTLEEAAAQLGKSRKFIARRARLSQLSAAWREAVADEESDVSTWSAAMLELIARFPVEVQDDLLEEQFTRGWENWTLSRVRAVLSSQLQMLHVAPWKLDDEALTVQGACTTCAKRSDRQPELFDEDELKPAKNGACAACLDGFCWDGKMQAFLRRKEGELKAKHGDVVIIGETWRMSDDSPWKKRALADYQVQHCKKSEAGALPALIVSGPEAGDVTWVKVGQTSSGGSAAPRTKAAPGEKTMADRREEIERLRGFIVVRAVMDKLQAIHDADETVNPLVDLGIDEGSTVTLVAAFGTSRFSHWTQKFGFREWEIYDALAEMKGQQKLDNVAGALLVSVADVLWSRLSSSLNSPTWDETDVKRVCEFFRWDYAGMWEEAVKAKPDPKSWAKLEREEAAKAGSAKGEGKKARKEAV